MKRISSLLLITGTIFLLEACTTEGTSWDIDAYAPVAETTMDITKMVGDENLQVLSDSALWLNVDVNAYTFDIDSLKEFPDIQSPYAYQWPNFGASIIGGAVLGPMLVPIDMSGTGIDLREMKLKSGKMTLRLTTTNNQRVIFTYSIPVATKYGVPFTFTDTIPALTAGQDSVFYSKEFDVSEYKIITTGPNNNDLSTFSAEVTVSSFVGDADMTIQANQIVFRIVNEMKDFVPYYGKGFVGELDLSQNNLTADLDALKAFRSGLIDIEQLSLWLTVHNTIGAELRFRPNYLTATNTNSGISTSLTHPQMGNNVNLNRALETGNMADPVIATLYTYAFNSGNSNIESIVELIPDKIEFSADMKLNPYGNIGGYTDFFYPDYPAFVQMKLQAPLKFSISQLLLIDTIANPFTSLEIVENIIDGQFLIRAENKFPIAMNLQLFTLDSSGVTTDSLLLTDLIPAAPVNAFNRVVTPINTELTATIDAAKIQHLKFAENIRIKGLFNTVPVSAGRLQMYEDYYLKIKLIADIKYHIAL